MRTMRRGVPPTLSNPYRRAILDAANSARPRRERPYRGGELLRAVHRCVQLRLVTPAVLRAAGFAGAARRLEQVTSARRGAARRRHAQLRAQHDAARYAAAARS